MRGTGLGWLRLAHDWEQLRAIMRPFDLPIVLAIIAGVVWYVYRRRRLTPEA